MILQRSELTSGRKNLQISGTVSFFLIGAYISTDDRPLSGQVIEKVEVAHSGRLPGLAVRRARRAKREDCQKTLDKVCAQGSSAGKNYEINCDEFSGEIISGKMTQERNTCSL